MASDSPREILRRGAWQARSEALHHASHGVDKFRAETHQTIPRMEHRKIGLRFSAAMAYRMQQSSIHPRQARESARIYTVVYVVVVVNHPNSSRIGHDDFVSEAAQEPADPRRVSSHLKHDPAAVCTRELRGKPCRGRSECSLREDFPFVAEDTVVTGFIADVDANDLIPPRGCQLRLFAALCSVASVFQCSSPFLAFVEIVDSIEAINKPSFADGLLPRKQVLVLLCTAGCFDRDLVSQTFQPSDEITL